MEMVAIEELVEEVISNLPGCDTMQGEDKLKDTAIEFFRVTGLWKHEMEWINVYADEPLYRLTYPLEAIPEKVKVVRFNEDSTTKSKPRMLHPMSEEDLRREYNGEWESIEGSPLWYTHITDVLSIRLVPIPIIAYPAALFIRMSVMPTRTAANLPAQLVDRYWPALAAGARYRLAKMKDQPWSDPGLAQVSLSTYNSGLATGTNDRSQSITGASQKMMAEFPLA